MLFHTFLIDTLLDESIAEVSRLQRYGFDRPANFKGGIARIDQK